MKKQTAKVPSVETTRSQSSVAASSDLSLKETLVRLIPEKRKEVTEFGKQYGDTKIGEVTVNMAYGGISIY